MLSLYFDKSIYIHIWYCIKVAYKFVQIAGEALYIKLLLKKEGLGSLYNFDIVMNRSNNDTRVLLVIDIRINWLVLIITNGLNSTSWK
jgi:hypothetical protein